MKTKPGILVTQEIRILLVLITVRHSHDRDQQACVRVNAWVRRKGQKELRATIRHEPAKL